MENEQDKVNKTNNINTPKENSKKIKKKKGAIIQ